MEIDRRLRKTEAAIQEAFVVVSSYSDPGQISLGEVIEEADINKSTFYLHYQSLVYVSYAIEDRLVSELVDSFHGAVTSKAKIQSLIKYLSKEKKAVYAVINATENHFYSKLFNAFKDYLISLFPSETNNEVISYKTASIFGGVYGMLLNWLYGPNRADKEKLLEVIQEFVKQNAEIKDS